MAADTAAVVQYEKKEELRMYRMIVVEDELLIRKGICKSMDWNTLGFEVVADFDDGAEALDYLAGNTVDVVLTDIVMCTVSGIELAKAVAENYPYTRVVLMSGFQEFKYAQKALEYGVFHYLLKPVSEKEMEAVFYKLKTVLDNETHQQIRQNDNTKILNDLANVYFRHIWVNDELSKQMHNWYTSLLGLSFSQKTIVYFFWEESAGQKLPVFHNIENHFQGILLPKNQFALVAWYPNSEDQNGVYKKAERYFANLFPNQLHPKMRMRTSKIDLSGTQDIVDFSQKSHTWKAAAYSWIKELSDKLYATVIKAEQERFRFGEMLLNLNSSKIFSFQEITLIIITAMSLANSKISETGLPYSVIKRMGSVIPLYTAQNIKDLEICLTEAYNDLKRVYDDYKKSSDNYGLKMILSYIDSHLNEDLSVSKLAEIAHMNTAYFGRYFKTVTGKKLKDYIYDVKMTRAIELMREDKYKISDIAAMIGYDAKYFFTIFKNYTHYSPKEYRDNFIDRV